MATATLYVTDVARPRLLASREDWSCNAVQQSIDGNDLEVRGLFCLQAKKVVDVDLRCAAGLVLGRYAGHVLHLCAMA